MEEQFVTDDKEWCLKYLCKQMILLDEQCSEYERQLIPLMAWRTVVFWVLGEKWSVLDKEYEETKVKVSALEKELEEQKVQESGALYFKGKEIELVTSTLTTEVNNAKLIDDDVSMSTESQELSCYSFKEKPTILQLILLNRQRSSLIWISRQLILSSKNY